MRLDRVLSEHEERKNDNLLIGETGKPSFFIYIFFFIRLIIITTSPSKMPALIIDSPLTFKVKIVSLAGIKFAGKEKNSFGLSIASIGDPAVTI